MWTRFALKTLWCKLFMTQPDRKSEAKNMPQRRRARARTLRCRQRAPGATYRPPQPIVGGHGFNQPYGRKHGPTGASIRRAIAPGDRPPGPTGRPRIKSIPHLPFCSQRMDENKIAEMGKPDRAYTHGLYGVSHTKYMSYQTNQRGFPLQ